LQIKEIHVDKNVCWMRTVKLLLGKEIFVLIGEQLLQEMMKLENHVMLNKLPRWKK